MVRPQSTRKAQMKTILILIVGLMLAACGSMENHVRNPGVVSTFPEYDRGDRIAIDTICACP
jgi:starvation-inducible outer membrane lipoprotein